MVNVSGFHVDPGFRGKLKFAVYNAGSKDIVLDQDEQVFMIWYADLDAPSPDPYPLVPVLPSVITSEDVSRLKGEVASPAELKKQIDEIKHDYDKRIQSVEISEKILRWLVGALLLLLVGTMFRAGVFDKANDQKARGAEVAQIAPQAGPKFQTKGKDEKAPGQPEERRADELPQAAEIKGIVGFGSARLGAWILGGSAMISVSVVLAALLLRSRWPRQR